MWDASLVPPMLSTLRACLGPWALEAGCSGSGSGSGGGGCCCCCQLDASQAEHCEEGEQEFLNDLAADMGLEDLSVSAASRVAQEEAVTREEEQQEEGVQCSEREWALAQRMQRRAPFALLAYTYRLDSTHEALMSGLSDGFCWSEVPLHRVPWLSLSACDTCGGGGGQGAAGRHRQRDWSDETVPHVRLFRVQLPCSRHSCDDGER